MTTHENPIRRLVAQQAIEWHLANRAGLDRTRAAEFAEWLKASPMHVEEYLALAQLAGDLRATSKAQAGGLAALIERALRDPAPAESVVELPVSHRPQRGPPLDRLRAATFGMAAALACVVAVGWWMLPTGATLHRASLHGQRLNERLPDASHITLDADSVADVHYSLRERYIALQRGQGLFEVAHNRWRPFRVEAGAVVVTAVGTRFNVERHDDVTVVSVLEGRVSVAPTGVTGSGLVPPVQVGAGQQLRVTGGQLTNMPHAIEGDHSVAWLEGRVECDEVPLAEVAAEVSRYVDKPVVVIGTALRTLPISGVFTAGDLDGFLAFVRSLEGAEVRVMPTRIEITAR